MDNFKKALMVARLQDLTIYIPKEELESYCSYAMNLAAHQEGLDAFDTLLASRIIYTSSISSKDLVAYFIGRLNNG